MPRIDINKVYLRNAYEFAQLSYAQRRKVGAIIVKNDQIISFGYNGMPSGFNNVCEVPIKPPVQEESDTDYLNNFKTNKKVLHAESNAITKVAQSTMSCKDATLYTTTAPCFECSKLIIQTGIKALYYCEDYQKDDGISLLKEVNMKIIRYNFEDIKQI